MAGCLGRPTRAICLPPRTSKNEAEQGRELAILTGVSRSVPHPSRRKIDNFVGVLDARTSPLSQRKLPILVGYPPRPSTITTDPRHHCHTLRGAHRVSKRWLRALVALAVHGCCSSAGPGGPQLRVHLQCSRHLCGRVVKVYSRRRRYVRGSEVQSYGWGHDGAVAQRLLWK